MPPNMVDKIIPIPAKNVNRAEAFSLAPGIAPNLSLIPDASSTSIGNVTEPEAVPIKDSPRIKRIFLYCK